MKLVILDRNGSINLHRDDFVKSEVEWTALPSALSALRAPVDAFFDGVMVNAEQTDLRLNRIGLLRALHAAMNRVAMLERLAV